MRNSNTRGADFEKRVLSALQELEKVGFARSIVPQERVSDRNGNERKIDLSFLLCTCLVELRISVECKSREKPLSLDDINQIKVFKAELPERNLFWIVVEGTAGNNVLSALKSSGISFYTIEQLESIVTDICTKYKKSDIDSLRKGTKMLVRCR